MYLQGLFIKHFVSALRQVVEVKVRDELEMKRSFKVLSLESEILHRPYFSGFRSNLIRAAGEH